jgi:hypothetical protein
MPEPKMTLGALSTTIGLTLRDLKLGPRSSTRSEAFADSVTVMFYLANPTSEDGEIVNAQFRKLADRYDWQPPKSVVNKKANTIHVLFQAKEISPTTTRMGL